MRLLALVLLLAGCRQLFGFREAIPPADTPVDSPVRDIGEYTP